MVMSVRVRPVVSPTEVEPRAHRRAFTAEYKRAILEEADACVEPGQIGALLRREGLYSSHLAEWRAARERGVADALEPKKRGPKPTPHDVRDDKIAQLELEIARLRLRAERAEALIEVQKKLAALLGTPFEEPSEKR